ncbi:MAG: hypothetical protein PVF50_03525, partial [Gammaproteobacteria bacterium]
MTTRYAAMLVALTVAAVGLVSVPAAQQPEIPDETASLNYVSSLRAARDGLISAGDFDAALEPARIVVDELESSDSSAAADRIMLAIILAELERHDEAELEFLDVVETLQEDEGQFSVSLIAPLQLLGRSYIRARQFP